MFDQVIRPVLEVVGLDYDLEVTSSPTSIEEWVGRTDLSTYTDFVLVGGDGSFSQFINSLYRHPLRSQLMRVPVAILPGGCYNCMACDVGH